MRNSERLQHVIKLCVKRFYFVHGLVLDQKRNMALWRVSLVVLFTVLAIGLTTASTVSRDTLMPSGISYVGYRIYIRNVKILKQKGSEYLLGMEVVNTGKRPISFGPGFPARYLQSRFDESLLTSGLLPLGLQIREGLLHTRETLDVGEWKTDIEILVRSDAKIEKVTLSRDKFERVSATIKRRNSGSDKRIDTERAASAKTPSDCVDLVISEVKILEQNKKNATVQVTITNGGSRGFPLDSIDQGLSLSLFVSGSARISNSSKKLKQINLTDRLSSQTKATLGTGEDVVLVERLDISTATRYTAVMIAQLDSGQVLAECNETNNEADTLLFK